MSDATWQSGNWWEPLTEMIQAKMEETKRRWEQERDARERTAFRHQSRFEHRKSPEDWPFGPGPGPFGPGFPFGPGWGKGFAGPRRGPRRARGDVRDAVLALLSEQPMHGYQIIQEITHAAATPGVRAPARSTRRSPSWRTRAWSGPSSPRAAASSTSPTRAARTSSPTPTSSARSGASSRPPPRREERTHPLSGLRDVAASVAAAVMQVAVAGDSAQQRGDHRDPGRRQAPHLPRARRRRRVSPETVRVKPATSDTRPGASGRRRTSATRADRRRPRDRCRSAPTAGGRSVGSAQRRVIQSSSDADRYRRPLSL